MFCTAVTPLEVGCEFLEPSRNVDVMFDTNFRLEPAPVAVCLGDKHEKHFLYITASADDVVRCWDPATFDAVTLFAFASNPWIWL